MPPPLVSITCATKASQKPLGESGFVNARLHVRHPSTVLYSRLLSPGPLAITIAVCASQACTPRKSSVAPSFAASGTAHFVQCAPPSIVRRTVPPVPLAQATVPSTESIPRSPAVVPESCICHTGCAGWPKAIAETAHSKLSQWVRMAGSIAAWHGRDKPLINMGPAAKVPLQSE